MEHQDRDIEDPLIPEINPIDNLKDNQMFFPFYRREIGQGDYHLVVDIIKILFLTWVLLFISGVLTI